MAQPQGTAKPSNQKPADANADGKVDKKELDAALQSSASANRSVSASGARLVAIARLRRDTMILASGKDFEEINQIASDAVKQGRAAEVFIFEALGYFSEAEIDFVEPDVVRYGGRRFDQDDATSALVLNPAKSDDEQSAAQEPVSDPAESDASKEPIPSGGAEGHTAS